MKIVDFISKTDVNEDNKKFMDFTYLIEHLSNIRVLIALNSLKQTVPDVSVAGEYYSGKKIKNPTANDLITVLMQNDFARGMFNDVRFLDFLSYLVDNDVELSYCLNDWIEEYNQYLRKKV